MHTSPMPNAAELARLTDAVIDIAQRAGAEILVVYGSDAGTTSKADDSPLTLADLRAHRLIVAALRLLTPDVPVLSEEDADLPWAVRSSWSRYWLVDPLDGTKEFLAKNGEFTVNIALVIDHQPVLGVVYVPVTKVVYAGIVGTGAWRSSGDEPRTVIRVCTPAPARLRVVGSRSHGGASLDALLARLGSHELLSIGSSLKLCRVAEGSADLYPRLGPTSEWDTAAAQAVVVAAGGFVVNLDGAALRYNAKPELLNPHFLVYGDPTRDWIAALQDR